MSRPGQPDRAERESARDDAQVELALARVRDALRGLAFGQITILVHDGAVVQVERTEKIRLSHR